MRKIGVMVLGVIILGLINYSIMSREGLIRGGKTVVLELAPVDPRSLMQGDYMALRFAVTADARNAMKARQGENQIDNVAGDGHIILRLDDRSVGTFSRIDDGSKLNAGEVKMLYRKRGNKMKFATNAFFFQEGKAELYEVAKYGEFKVADNGDSILVAMLDEGLEKINP